MLFLYVFFCRKDTRGEAFGWINNYRSKHPAVYNQARLLEQPLPPQPNLENEPNVDELSLENISIREENNSLENVPLENRDPLANDEVEVVGERIDEVYVISSEDESDGAYGGAASSNVRHHDVKIECKGENDSRALLRPPSNLERHGGQKERVKRTQQQYSRPSQSRIRPPEWSYTFRGRGKYIAHSRSSHNVFNFHFSMAIGNTFTAKRSSC